MSAAVANAQQSCVSHCAFAYASQCANMLDSEIEGWNVHTMLVLHKAARPLKEPTGSSMLQVLRSM